MYCGHGLATLVPASLEFGKHCHPSQVGGHWNMVTLGQQSFNSKTNHSFHLLWKRKTFVAQKAQLTILSEYVWVEEWDCKSLILWDSKVYIAVFKYIYEAICTVQVHYDNNIVLRFPQKQMIVCNVNCIIFNHNIRETFEKFYGLSFCSKVIF